VGRTKRPLTAAAVAALGGLGLFALVAPLSRLLLAVELPNEGWNAVHAARWMAGGPLYPPPGSWIVNNYPPLWFMLEGGLGAWLAPWPGGLIVAGRLIALAAFALVAALIAAVVRALGGDRLAGFAAASGFVAVIACAYTPWIGLAEPQMLAHALALAGLAMLLRARRGTGAALAALPMIAALLVKHNVFAVPLAALLWLAWYRRPLLAPWLAAAVLAGAVAAAAILAGFGTDAVAGLSYPRLLSFGRLATSLGHASKVAVILAAWAVFLWLTRGPPADPAAGLVTCALVAAVVEIAATGGALGVSSNVAFDLVIAASLALGLLVTRLTAPDAGMRAALPWRGDAAAALLVAAVAVRAAASLSPEALAPFDAQQRVLRAAVVEDGAALRARLAALDGPVACESLSLCLWAGHRSDVDLWKLRHERTLSPTVDPQDVVARIARGDYGAVVLLGRVDGPAADGNLPGLLAALERTYPGRAISGRFSVFWR